MIVLYLWFTVQATNWRIKIRRTMNESDTEANTKAIDSLLNYETVKYFGAEEREARRYDQSMAAYEQASVKAYTSLAVLNAGQAAIFTVRAHPVHGDGGPRRDRRADDGRPVRDGERAAAAALHPAQFHGHGVSRDQAVADRHRAHDGRAGGDARGGRPAGCAATGGRRRHHPLRGREVPLRARADHPRRPLLRGAGRQDGGHRRARRAPASRRCRASCCASTTWRAAA